MWVTLNVFPRKLKPVTTLYFVTFVMEPYPFGWDSS